MCVSVCLQEASRNAEELLDAEEREKKAAEKKKKRNRKVGGVNIIVLRLTPFLFSLHSDRKRSLRNAEKL